MESMNDDLAINQLKAELQECKANLDLAGKFGKQLLERNQELQVALESAESQHAIEKEVFNVIKLVKLSVYIVRYKTTNVYAQCRNSVQNDRHHLMVSLLHYCEFELLQYKYMKFFIYFIETPTRKVCA